MNLLLVFCFSLLVFLACCLVARFGPHWNLKPWVAFSAGALLSVCFLDFLPHAFEGGSGQYEKISLLILAGVLTQRFAENYLLPRLSFLDKWLKVGLNKPQKVHSHSLSPGVVCSLVGCLTLCAFFDGIRLYAALSIKELLALKTAFALFFHLLSEGVLVAVLAFSSGIKQQALLVLLFCLTGAVFLGALFAYMFLMLSSAGGLIAFSVGILMYINFAHLLPFCLKQKSEFWLFAGVAVFLLVHFLI